MIGLYFNDANLLTENREEEQYAEAALNSILAGKTVDMEFCFMKGFELGARVMRSALEEEMIEG